MAQPSPVSQALHEGFEQDFLPLLRRIGFSPARSSRVQPGLIVALAVRPLDERRRLEVTLWCQGPSGHQLRFRLDLVEPVEGLECTGQVPLTVPWPDPTFPRARSLDFAGGEFLPHQGTDRLRIAITFLAGAFAACVDQFAAAVPELQGALRDASAEASWRAAAARGADLWSRRHQRGEVDGHAVDAKVVFVGERLVSLDAGGVRLTFRFDTRRFDRSLPTSVADWYATPAGTRSALRLVNGATSWSFDPRGQLLGVSPPDA